MSWHFLQEQEEASWEASSLDGAPSALLNLLPTHEASFSPASETGCLIHSRSGMTCGPSTATLGAGMLMSSPEDFPARTFPYPGGGLDLRENVPACGLKWRESLAKFDRDSCSWKTAQPLFPEDSTAFLGILPAWGSMRSGELFPQPTAALRTCENESGFWPTLLASDGPNGGPNSRGSKGDLRLSAAVHTFPTLKARDYRSGSKPESRRARAQRTGEVHSPDLNDVVAPGGQLNPTWCEWFMGFPEGWTELKPLEILKYQQWRRSHSAPSCAA